MTGNQIKKRLEELSLTQEIAAKQLGITVRTLQNWIAKEELDEKVALLFSGIFMSDHNNFQQTKNGHNVNGNGNKLNPEVDKFLDLLKKKDEQIDRLLALLEKQNK
ncbi:MAG: hypothetical protein RR551_08225 [Mucinivorans sp.]